MEKILQDPAFINSEFRDLTNTYPKRTYKFILITVY